MQQYTAVVEVAQRGNMTADEVDAFMQRVPSNAVSVSVSPHGYRAVRITLPANDIAQAASAAAIAVAHGAGTTVDQVVSIDVMTEDEADSREGYTDVPDLIGAGEAAELLGVSPQRIRQMIDEGKLAAHRIGERSFALVRAEVLAKTEARN